MSSGTQSRFKSSTKVPINFEIDERESRALDRRLISNTNQSNYINYEVPESSKEKHVYANQCSTHEDPPESTKYKNIDENYEYACDNYY
jgi:hypothetical protein